MVSKRVRHPGFALIDVLVAGVLTGVVLAVAMGLAAQAVSSQTRGEQLEIAAMLADERLNLVLMTGPDRYEGFYELAGACDPPFERYTYAVEIESRGEATASAVRVTISWPAIGGARTLSIDTLMAPRLGDDPDPDRKPSETIDRGEEAA